MIFNFVEICNTINKRFDKNLFDISFLKYFLPPGYGSGSSSKWTLTRTYNSIRNTIIYSSIIANPNHCTWPIRTVRNKIANVYNTYTVQRIPTVV